MRRLVSRIRACCRSTPLRAFGGSSSSTFTFVQSNYSVHADISGGDADARLLPVPLRLYVPYVTHPMRAGHRGCGQIGGDLGVVRVDTGRALVHDLAGPGAPKIIAGCPSSSGWIIRRNARFHHRPAARRSGVRDVVLYDVTIPNGGTVSFPTLMRPAGNS